MAETNDVIINVRAQVNEAIYDLRRLQKEVNNGARVSFKTLAQQQEVVRKSQERLNRSLGNIPFQGWAMSIMFFGMALSRMFNEVKTFGVRAFQDVMHSVEGTVTQFDLLQASTQYLGFTIGAALEPVVAFLIPIVDAIANWVAQNPELTAGLLIVAGVLGTIFTVVGALVLAAAGFYQAWLLIAPAVQAVGAAIGAGFGLPVLGVIAAIAAAIIALIIMWKTNFAGIQEFVKSTFGIIWNVVKGVFDGLKNIFQGLFLVLKGLFTGDFTMIMNGLIKIVQGAVKIIVNIFVGLGAAIINIFIFVVNMVTSSVMNFVKIILGMIKMAIDAYNAIPGTKDISTKGLDSAITKMEQLKQSMQIGYISAEATKSAITNITDMRVFNIQIDSSTDSNTVDTVMREIKASRS